MRYRLARVLQVVGLILLPLAMALQLQGMSVARMLVVAGVGVGVFYAGCFLQQNARP